VSRQRDAPQGQRATSGTTARVLILWTLPGEDPPSHVDGERARIHRRAWLAAGDRRRREIKVLHETGVDQFSGEAPSADGRDPLYAHCAQLYERVDQCLAGVDDDGCDPGTLGERHAHDGDSTGRGQEDETKLGNVVEELAIDRDTAASATIWTG